MHTSQIGGRLNNIFDPVTRQPVDCSAFGNVSFEFNGDPNAIAAQLCAQILQAAGAVVGEKIAANQVALPTLAQSLPYFIPEIVARSNAQGLGVQITQLQLNVNVQAAAPVAPPAPLVMPPTPMQSAAASMQQHASDQLKQLDPRNYEYEARLNVGGFKINASTDGGLDTAGLKNQVVDKAKSNLIWYGAGCVIVVLVLAGLAGLGGYIYYQAQSSTTAPSGPGKAAKWDGKSEFSCAGSDNVKLEGITANLPGTALRANANCKLEIVNCNITAPTGLEANASATVTVKGGSINSSVLAVKAAGNAKVTLSGTKVTGKTQALGAAKITGP